MNALYSFPLRPYPTRARTVVTTHLNGMPCSYVEDPSWDYHGMLDAKVGAVLEVSFKHINEADRLGIQFATHLITRGKQVGISSITNTRNALQIIAELLGSTDWKQIDQETRYTEFKKAFKARKPSQTTVDRIVAALRDLWRVGLITRYVQPGDKSIKKWGAGKRREQHIALPERMAYKLFAAAIEIVERYHPHRHVISAAYDAYLHAKSTYKGKAFARDVGNDISHDVPFDDFYLEAKALCASEIQTACWLVLIGFSGVREAEGKSMNPASYDESRCYKGRAVPLLHGLISKNQRAGKPMAESWVTHPIAKLALELAYDSSEFARKHYRTKLEGLPPSPRRNRQLTQLSSAFLVLSTCLQEKQVIMGNTQAKLRKFAKKYGVRALADDVVEFDALNPTRKGQLKAGALLPKLSNHDFRRSYACFLIRNRLGNLMSLRAQYKHDNLMMTNWYQNGTSMAAVLDLKMDTELQQMIQEANLAIHENTLFHIFNESETLTGFEGRRIIAEREKYQVRYPGQIYMSREDIRAMLRTNSISVVEHPTGYCFNPECDRICASDKSTETCKHEVLTPEKVLETKLPRYQRWIRKFRALNSGRYYMAAILTDILTEIKAIEKTLSEHNIPFEPFVDKVKIARIGEAL